MATLTVDVQINGTGYGPNSGSAGSINHFNEVWFGALFSSASNDFQIRNITVGTSGFGSSDLFAPALTSTSDFDSIVNPGTGLTVSGGILQVTNAGDDTYGIKNIGSQTEIWVQFDLKVTAAMIAANSFTCDYHDIAETTFGQIDGIYSQNKTNPARWNTDGPGPSAFGTGPPADTWVTVGMHYMFPAITSASITLTPTSGSVGSTVNIDGSGFAHSSALTATFNGSPITLSGTTVTDSSGNFTGATFTVPSLSPGTYTVVVTDASSNSANKPFTITNDFVISITPGTLTFSAPGTQTATISLSLVPGSTDQLVDLTVSSFFAPNSVTSITPTTVHADGGTATLSVTMNRPQNAALWGLNVQGVGESDSTTELGIAFIRVNSTCCYPMLGPFSRVGGVDAKLNVLPLQANNNYNGARFIDMCVHQGELWVVHTEFDRARSIYCGPWVHKWNGSSWVQIGGEIVTSTYSHTEGDRIAPWPVRIASDPSGDVYIAYEDEALHLSSGAGGFLVNIRKCNGGSWDLLASSNALGFKYDLQTTTANTQPSIGLIANNGKAWVSWRANDMASGSPLHEDPCNVHVMDSNGTLITAAYANAGELAVATVGIALRSDGVPIGFYTSADNKIIMFDGTTGATISTFDVGSIVGPPSLIPIVGDAQRYNNSFLIENTVIANDGSSAYLLGGLPSAQQVNIRWGASVNGLDIYDVVGNFNFEEDLIDPPENIDSWSQACSFNAVVGPYNPQPAHEWHQLASQVIPSSSDPNFFSNPNVIGYSGPASTVVLNNKLYVAFVYASTQFQNPPPDDRYSNQFVVYQFDIIPGNCGGPPQINGFFRKGVATSIQGSSGGSSGDKHMFGKFRVGTGTSTGSSSGPNAPHFTGVFRKGD